MTMIVFSESDAGREIIEKILHASLVTSKKSFH